MANKIVYRQYGGKSSVAKWVVSHFPEHKVYLEPFCGSCAILFAKEPSFIEIVNDIDTDIIGMFRLLRSDPKTLAAMLWATPYSNTNWRGVYSSSDLENAVLAIAESQQFYSGNRNTSTWAIDKCPNPHKPKAKVWADWFTRVLPGAARLKDVTILNEDAIKAIGRLKDNPEALIYVDPPYLGHEKEYKHHVNYKAMIGLLDKAKAKVVVSEYPEAADYYKGWHRVDKVTAGRARTGAHNMKAKVKTECLFIKP